MLQATNAGVKLPDTEGGEDAVADTTKRNGKVLCDCVCDYDWDFACACERTCLHDGVMVCVSIEIVRREKLTCVQCAPACCCVLLRVSLCLAVCVAVFANAYLCVCMVACAWLCGSLRVAVCGCGRVADSCVPMCCCVSVYVAECVSVSAYMTDCTCGFVFFLSVCMCVSVFAVLRVCLPLCPCDVCL